MDVIGSTRKSVGKRVTIEGIRAGFNIIDVELTYPAGTERPKNRPWLQLLRLIVGYDALAAVPFLLFQPIRHTSHQIHPFVQDRNYKGGRIVTRQAENVVMLATDHPQSWIKRSHVLEDVLSCSNTFYGSLQLGHIATCLRVAPLA